MPVLRRAPDRDLRRPRHVAALRELPHAGTSSTTWSPSTRCTCASAGVLPRAARGVRAAEEIFTRVRLLLVLLDLWLEHARRYVEMIIERLGLGEGQPRRRAREQRRLPAPALRRRTAFPCSASSRPRTSPRWRSRRASRRVAEFFGVDCAKRLRRRGQARRPDRGQQRVRPRARPQRLRRRDEDRCSRPRASSRSSSPT